MAVGSMDFSHHNTSTPRGVELPNDIWLSVIERISLVSLSDLKALCLTSKSLRVLATPHLYDTVCIPLWNTPKVDAFYRSVGCGAGVHLGNTRALIFEDQEGPEEGSCNLVGPFAFPNTSLMPTGDRHEIVSNAVKDHAMYTILQFFAQSKQLKTYRFIGSRRQSGDMMTLLHIHHPNMEYIQATLGYGDEEGFLIRKPFLHTLDLRCVEPESLRGLIPNLSLYTDTLTSLSIGCSLSLHSLGEVSAAMMIVLEDAQLLTNVKSLTLRHFELSDMFNRLCNLVDVGQLSRLSLLGCEGWEMFLIDMAKEVDTKSLKLKHFALQDAEEGGPYLGETSRKISKVLDTIVTSPIPESLHFSWKSEMPYFERHLATKLLYPTAPNLVSFSSHSSLTTGQSNAMDILELNNWKSLSLETLFDHCSKLQSFGFKVPELHLQPYDKSDRFEPITVDDRFMSALRRAPDLRILHLRQSNYVIKHGYGPDSVIDEHQYAWAFQTQRWANAFFAYLHERGWCPKLKALVIRCYKLSEYTENDVHAYLPQSCYIKGFQTGTFGRSGVVAVPVTRSMLRATEPCAEILDYDPEQNWGIGAFIDGEEMDED